MDPTGRRMSLRESFMEALSRKSLLVRRVNKFQQSTPFHHEVLNNKND